MKQFDLNIEKILENWDSCHGIREIIANALDEQLLTETGDVEINNQGNAWHIRDYGRGLRHNHFTQNENQEKLLNPNVIGKFGIGLKDALATFDRNGIKVFIKSKHAEITLSKTLKEGFADIKTLHANISPASDTKFAGTEFVIEGITDADISQAKSLFLKFTNEKVLEVTKAGEIVRKVGDTGKIYINGVKVAEEPNFLFSYNITVLTTRIKKALNRERTNVGRTAYADSIQKILLSCKSVDVATELADDLENIQDGTAHDELSWIEVQEHSVKILNQNKRVLFVSSVDLIYHRDMIDEAEASGHTIVNIPERLKHKIKGGVDLSGKPIIDISRFVSNYNDSFEFKFIDVKKLTAKEKGVYNFTDDILKLIGGKPKAIKEIKISATMRKDFSSRNKTVGVWDRRISSIIIQRGQLKSIKDYAGTLIHEAIHAKSGLGDVSRNFEHELTIAIGQVCDSALTGKKASGKLK